MTIKKATLSRRLRLGAAHPNDFTGNALESGGESLRIDGGSVGRFRR